MRGNRKHASHSPALPVALCHPSCPIPYTDHSHHRRPWTIDAKQKRKPSSLRCSFLIVRRDTGNLIGIAGQRLSESAAKIAHAAHAHGHQHGHHHGRLLLHTCALLSSMLHLKWCCKEDNTVTAPLSTLFARGHCVPFVVAGDRFVKSSSRLAFPVREIYNNNVCLNLHA